MCQALTGDTGQFLASRKLISDIPEALSEAESALHSHAEHPLLSLTCMRQGGGALHIIHR